MHIKFKKAYKLRKMQIKEGEILDIHWRKAIELIKDGTAEFQPANV